VTNEFIPGTPSIRRIVRQVSSTFWLFREIFPYGEDCELISPEPLRQRFQEKVRSLAERYEQ
jgi:predicted DNA-binding transcriptional regulator YafY